MAALHIPVKWNSIAAVIELNVLRRTIDIDDQILVAMSCGGWRKDADVSLRPQGVRQGSASLEIRGSVAC
jgi:hypothetical protein